VRSRSIAIVGFHLLVALLFMGVAGYEVYNGEVVNAVMQIVLGTLIVVLGIGLARAA
jgi:uncharacterized membrane protein